MSVLNFLIELANYFRTKDYPVPYTFEQDALKLLYLLYGEQSSIFEYNLYELEPYIETFFVKNESQSLSFHYDYNFFIEYFDKPELTSTQKSEAYKFKKSYEHSKKEKNDIDESIASMKKEENNIDKRIEKSKRDVSPVSDAIIKRKEQEFNKIKKEYKKLSKGLDSKLVNFLDYLKTPTELAFNKNKKSLLLDLSKLTDKSLTSKQSAELLKYIKWQVEVVSKIEKATGEDFSILNCRKETIKNDLIKLSVRKKEKEEFLKDNKSKYSAISKLIIKEEAKTHRIEFTGGHNSVQSAGLGEISNVEFNKLSEEEKIKIKHYISTNAIEMKTRLHKNIRTKQKKNLDMAETVKKACSTNGVPIRLMYKKPKREKVKLILFMDISGSCKNATETLMHFAYSMREAFPGGCKSFVFVNSLNDVSDFFDSANAEMAMKEIHKKIPTVGIYSDYYTPLKDYYTNHLNEIDKNTIIFFMGDARNNQNPSGEEFIKEIASRARKTYFMNTEPKEKWNTNDSIINIYSKYMDKTFESATPKQLVEAVMNVR